MNINVFVPLSSLFLRYRPVLSCPSKRKRGWGVNQRKKTKRKDPLRSGEKPSHTQHGMATDCRDASPGGAFEVLFFSPPH
jgi:hypothetical protein